MKLKTWIANWVIKNAEPELTYSAIYDIEEQVNGIVLKAMDEIGKREYLTITRFDYRSSLGGVRNFTTDFTKHLRKFIVDEIYKEVYARDKARTKNEVDVRSEIYSEVYNDEYIKTLIKKINEYQVVMNHDFRLREENK